MGSSRGKKAPVARVPRAIDWTPRITAALASRERLLELLEESEGDLVHLVAQVRAQGESWSSIGGRFGMSKQAAQQRFGRADV